MKKDDTTDELDYSTFDVVYITLGIYIPFHPQLKDMKKMKKVILFLGSIAALTACSTFKQSEYQSGWNGETNEAAYSECGAYRLKKGMPIQQNLDRLVTLGKLSPEQALRASKVEVRPGDPECLAYAAYGLNRKDIVITKNLNGLVIGKQATYVCADSDVSCPGVKVEFSDGKVTTVTPIR